MSTDRFDCRIKWHTTSTVSKILRSPVSAVRVPSTESLFLRRLIEYHLFLRTWTPMPCRWLSSTSGRNFRSIILKRSLSWDTLRRSSVLFRVSDCVVGPSSAHPASLGTVEASDCVRRMPPPRGGMSPTLSPSLPFTKDCTALDNEISDTSIESHGNNAYFWS